ncbi:MAG: lysophospholipid acyltransferase family protein [bacterium]|nr:lysophospholipid acyltransferase family protein [bacterium]
MKKIRFLLEYFFLMVFTYFFRLFPLSFNLWLARGIGLLLFRVNKTHRNRALENLRFSYPGKPEPELYNIARKTYVNLSKVFMEFLVMPGLNGKYYGTRVKLIGRENLDRALRQKKGIVAISGHLDNWELLGAILVRSGYHLDAVYHPMKNPFSDRFFNRIREKTGIKLISMDNPLRPSLRALKENHMLGLIADQDAGSDSVFVPFFNRLAPTYKGPALFSIKTGAPMILITLVRDEKDNHTMYISEPLNVKVTGDLKQDLYYNTKLWSDELEKWIKKYPEQWYWVHRRWHSRPR